MFELDVAFWEDGREYLPVVWRVYNTFNKVPEICSKCRQTLKTTNIVWVRVGDDSYYMCYKCAYPHILMSKLS